MMFLMSIALLFLEAHVQLGRKTADTSNTAVRVSEHATCNDRAPLGSGEAPTEQLRPLYQISDVHGDYHQLKRLMKKLGLITVKGEADEGTTDPSEEKWTWTGGNSIVVFTGDYVDRGLHSAWILRRLHQLMTNSAHSGGEVILLRGNHEQMLIDGDYRFMQLTDAKGYFAIAKKFADDFPIFHNRQEKQIQTLESTMSHSVNSIWYNGSCLLKNPHTNPLLVWGALNQLFDKSGLFGRSLQEMPVIKVVQGVLFVHGGITFKTLLGTSFRLRWQQKFFGYITRVKTLAKKLETYQFNRESDSPLWDRTVADDDPKRVAEKCEDVDKTLKALGAKRMVVGHTIVFNNTFVCRCKCKVILTDRGMSRKAGNDTCLTNTYDGHEMKPVNALYSDPNGGLFQLIEKNVAKQSANQTRPDLFEEKKIESEQDEATTLV
eukprot:TRINITY_DN33292_c0_g1_i1.p1 TRINITY_DN33292_c0_g1~~TRINITY_DN33292_c0_g1_i1.p1  ORF type:complete len:434 (-),score=40.70 TRINITY_DN33292_c0_g1_i1:89-1390(-)